MYFKYIDIPNYDVIQTKLQHLMNTKYSHLLDTPAVSVIGNVCPELVCDLTEIDELYDYFQEKELARSIVLYLLFVVPPNQEEFIHIDGNNVAPYLNDMRLLLPIMNTENVKTRFYESSKPPIVDKFIGDHSSKQNAELGQFDPAYCTEITHYELTRPTIVNPSIPHGIDKNTNDKPRVSIGISFNKRINLNEL